MSNYESVEQWIRSHPRLFERVDIDYEMEILIGLFLESSFWSFEALMHALSMKIASERIPDVFSQAFRVGLIRFDFDRGLLTLTN